MPTSCGGGLSLGAFTLVILMTILMMVTMPMMMAAMSIFNTSPSSDTLSGSVSSGTISAVHNTHDSRARHGMKRHAYATMLYMGTPRDHEFYVAVRVMMQSLLHLNVDADLVVIASRNLPRLWVKTL